jgi:hypothetical protein
MSLMSGIGQMRDEPTSLPPGVDQHERVELRRAADDVLEHQMRVQARHEPVEIVARCDSERLHPFDRVPLRQLDRLKGAFEMLSDDVRGRVQRVLGIRPRAVPKVGKQDRRPECDRGDQHRSRRNDPPQRAVVTRLGDSSVAAAARLDGFVARRTTVAKLLQREVAHVSTP